VGEARSDDSPQSEMSKPIYVDFDDVLCETAQALTVAVAREFGKTTSFDDIFSFDLTESFGLDAAESDRLIEMFHDPDVLINLAPVPGAKRALQAWHDLGAIIHIVTGRPPATCAVSETWLASHGMPYDRLSFVDKYSRCHTDVPGVDTLTLDELKACEFSVAIDDSPTAIRFLAEHTDVPIVVFDRPWNVDLGDLCDNAQIMRCVSWSHVLEQISNP
jgi:uncharacterized HAD superfamily protein